MTFEEWIKGEMGRGLSQLEVDQMRAAWMAALTAERMMSDKLKKALEYVLNDEMNLIPRATSSCRITSNITGRTKRSFGLSELMALLGQRR